MTPDICAINRALRIAVLDDDRVIPITNWLDAYGDETLDPYAAVSFVAGPCEGVGWFYAPISAYEEAMEN